MAKHIVGGKLPEKSNPVAVAAFKEVISQHRIETGTGDTDLPFDAWLKSVHPTLYPKWLKATGQGQ